MDGYEVRRVRADEWEQSKQLRLEALQDPVAHLAFLETYEQGLARPDDEWRQRTVNGSAGDTVAQFVAVADGAMVGNVVVLVAHPGEKDYMGEVADRTRAALVGVFIRPEHRGRGLFGGLLAAAVTWVDRLGIGELALFVHEDNARAWTAYSKAGFAESGHRRTLAGGVEIEMVRRIQ